MKNIKAIMCDVDGTLLNGDHVVSKKTVEMIKKARKKGILFGLSTGRDVPSVTKLLKPWGIDGLVDIIVGSGGAEIYDYTDGSMEQNYPLEGGLILEVVDHFKDMDVNFAIPHEGTLYAPKEDEYITFLAHADRVPYQVVDFKEFLKEPKIKLMIITKEEDMDKVVERAQTFHSEKYKSSSLKTGGILYEYMDPRISKTFGLKKALKKHHIDLENLCTFGDADNDYDMTLHAGVGVVMANGSQKTKSVADYITDDNEHDGVANFIENYIL